MISRLITMLLFTWSVYMAAFGQHIFGREHIIEMTKNIGPTVTVQSQVISQETARFLASIEPSAGQEAEKQIFTFVLVDALTPKETMSFITDQETDKNLDDKEKTS